MSTDLSFLSKIENSVFLKCFRSTFNTIGGESITGTIVDIEKYDDGIVRVIFVTDDTHGVARCHHSQLSSHHHKINRMFVEIPDLESLSIELLNEIRAYVEWFDPAAQNFRISVNYNGYFIVTWQGFEDK